MPSFHRRSFVNLNATLQGFGMRDAFDRNKADFTGINGGNDLFLTAFSQITELKMGPQPRSSRQAPEEHHHHAEEHQHVLKFERQFLYAIRHNPSGMVTHIGRYYDPTNDSEHEHNVNIE